MDKFQDDRLSEDFHLLYLKNQACQHPPDDVRRQIYLTQLIRCILKSGRLWKESSTYYEDALQMTWVYCCQNLCEAVTTKSPYDSSLSSIITWLNVYLKWRLHDLALKSKQDHMQVGLSAQAEHSVYGDSSQCRPEVSSIFEETLAWVEEDPSGELQRLRLNKHPHITAQYLILKRLPPETSWKALSDELQVSISTLSSFYRRHCLPNLRKFGKNQGYL